MEKIIGFTKDGMPVRIQNMALQEESGIGIGGIAAIIAVVGIFGFVAIKASSDAERTLRKSRRR